MFSKTPIAAALALLLWGSACAAPSAPGTTPGSLLSQSEGLPKDFEEHFFDVPLAVRVELDQQFLGEAMIVLGRDDRITLLEFTDIGDSNFSASERDTWQQLLQQGMPLGGCESSCPAQLLAIHYSLENSLVSILTENIERNADIKQFYEQPESGSHGLIINNQLNLNGGENEEVGGRYGLEASSSLGNWTQAFNLQVSRFGGTDTTLYHAVHELYTQRELEGNFVRLGYFTPGSDGLTRQIRSFGASPDTAVGMMYGSSDSLLINNPKPSVYPIYVTASRQAAVEIYRNGLLINTQPVAAGLQTLDTRTLPGGIYEVEVRLIEDGVTTSTSQELVYKPNNWRNPDERWLGVNAAAPVLEHFLDAELARHKLPPSALALVGFSQGTMMSLHVGLRRAVAPAAIVGYSGMLVLEGDSDVEGYAPRCAPARRSCWCMVIRTTSSRCRR